MLVWVGLLSRGKLSLFQREAVQHVGPDQGGTFTRGGEGSGPSETFGSLQGILCESQRGQLPTLGCFLKKQLHLVTCPPGWLGVDHLTTVSSWVRRVGRRGLSTLSTEGHGSRSSCMSDAVEEGLLKASKMAS